MRTGEVRGSRVAAFVIMWITCLAVGLNAYADGNQIRVLACVIVAFLLLCVFCLESYGVYGGVIRKMSRAWNVKWDSRGYPMYHILRKRKAIPATCHQWSIWFTKAKDKDRRVALTAVGDTEVSTVFCGCGSIFETLTRGPDLEEQIRSKTWEEAEQVHEEQCARVRAFQKLREEVKRPLPEPEIPRPDPNLPKRAISVEGT